MLQAMFRQSTQKFHQASDEGHHFFPDWKTRAQEAASVESGSQRALRIVEADAQTDARWLAFVEGHPEALIYHHPAWLQALAAEYGERSVNLLCEDGDGEVRGVLPLLESSGLLTRRRLMSLPRTPLAGPLAVDRETTATLVRAALEQVCRSPGVTLRLKVAAPGLDALVPGLVGFPSESTYSLRLPARAEDLRFGNSRNHARIRWAVSKAAGLGVGVRPAESENDLHAWYVLYLEAMRSHNVPPRPYRFFEALWRILRPQGLMRLLLAEQRSGKRGTLLAGSVLLTFGDTVSYAFNGRRGDALALRPNDAIQWRAIHDACVEGFRRYDFGEVPAGNQGLAGFKSKWRNEADRLYRYYYPGCEPKKRDIEANEPVWEVAKFVWRRLPLRATALLGDQLYRHL